MSTPRSNSSRKNLSRQLPEVADHEPVVPGGECLDLSIDPRTEELVHLKDFRVFLKRNLPYQAPPADLLDNIRARIDRIKADE